MPRSGDEARERLRNAALELYLEHGYDSTTTAQIAARAHVTERTYFRHFADKREVLFDDGGALRDVMVTAIADAPEGTAPLALVIAAYVAAVPLFVAGRPVAVRRAEVIAATPALMERAQAKTAALADAVITALAARGIPEATARLAAQVGSAAFECASREWYPRPRQDLAALIEKAADEVRAL
ncbi:MAG: helix-turn-helix domain-containing protein [Leifsonia sp.]